MDVHLGARFGAEARKVVLYHDHSEADRLFDTVLSRTLFSFRTNRHLFRGMIAFQDDERWKQIFDEILRRSRYDLPDSARDRYLRLSYEYVMDYLAKSGDSRAASLDPVGDINLRLAKELRREAMDRHRSAQSEKVEEVMEEFFPLPTPPFLYLPRARGLEVPGLTDVGETGNEPA
jgi:hypothetical protein